MDPARWRAASLRLDEALELTGDPREQWMAALCEQDPQLAGDVRALLDEYDVIQRDGFLEGACIVRPGEAAGGVAPDGTLPGIAPDESWLLWAQDDYRNTDIMMIAQRP